MKGRIFLNTRLFPEGHALTKFRWSARLFPGSGLFFDFDIQSEPYCSDYEGELQDEYRFLWESKELWANAGSCWIDSTGKWETGFLVGDSANPFSFDQLDSIKYYPDPLDPLETYWENEERSFAANILDHDYVGGHSIGFKKQATGLYAIDWTGKIAITNQGDFEFDHDFVVEASEVVFHGIRFPSKLDLSEARAELAKYVVDIDMFSIKTYQTDTRSFPEPRFVPV